MIGIMQPYFLPYLGYFQLINCVDEFVFLDDVNYIKKGWIDRNFIYHNDSLIPLKIPIINASQNKKINESYISDFNNWKDKILLTIRNIYSKHEFYQIIDDRVLSIIREIEFGSPISDLNFKLLSSIITYLQIDTKFYFSSISFPNVNNLSGQDRILDIVKKSGDKKYINPIGGINLYQSQFFKNFNIELFFIQTNYSQYPQRNLSIFTPNLSILDILMNCEVDYIKNKLLTNFNLITNG
jgi:hypothetical protein